jgi:uncharacterized membrane protein HdeD (DUF308 family)
MSQPRTERVIAADVAPAAMITSWFADRRVTDGELKQARNWLVATGILALIGGTAAIVVPPFATLTIAIFIGWILVYAGLVMAIHAWTQRGAGRAWERALQALLTLVVGVYIVLLPGGGAISLTLLLVVWFLGTGGLQLAAARRLWGLPGAGIVLFNGGLSILLAVLIVADLPSSAAWAIGLLVGINLVFWGIRALLAAGMLKRASAT